MNAWMLGTSGRMPYESKWWALENVGWKCTASQCEHPSVRESALTMIVEVSVIDCGRRSEAKT